MFNLDFPEFSVNIVIHTAVIDRLKKYRQLSPNATEACGVLLGLEYENRFEITDITEPQISDVRTRTSYLRSRKGHVEDAVRKWEMSGKTVGYIGEWHTHPEFKPRPSFRDLKETQAIAKLNKEVTVILIIGFKYACCTVVNSERYLPPQTFLL